MKILKKSPLRNRVRMKGSTIAKILDALKSSYPKDDQPWHQRSDPFKTLIATILSAQTTDDQVDKITPELFKRYPTPKQLAKARIEDIERIIKSVGLYKAKAKNIIAAAQMICDAFASEVPGNRIDLITLPGVGRKTANVVLIKSFGINAMPVDTHVLRVSVRIGLASGKTPEDVERELEFVIPESILGAAHFWLIEHGRKICSARSPKCSICPIIKWCRFSKKT